MTCHIQVNHLTLNFHWKNLKKSIFEDLNLCIPSGAFVTITGSNGSGKSSLVKLILGLVSPDSGEILVNDLLVRPGYPEAVRKQEIAYLSQQVEDLFFGVTLVDELNYQSPSLDNQAIMEVLKALDLDKMQERQVETLSGGERQSLALAQFMMSEAQILILDEPTSYLDQKNVIILNSFLKKSHEAGKTILHVTQFSSEVKWGTHAIDLDQQNIVLKMI